MTQQSTPVELLEAALAAAIAMQAVSVTVALVAADGSEWVWQSVGQPISQWEFGASEVPS